MKKSWAEADPKKARAGRSGRTFASLNFSDQNQSTFIYIKRVKSHQIVFYRILVILNDLIFILFVLEKNSSILVFHVD